MQYLTDDEARAWATFRGDLDPCRPVPSSELELEPTAIPVRTAIAAAMV